MDLKEVFSGVWIARAAIQLVLTSLAVWGISYGVSFKVSDYVVKANTSSSNTTLEALTGSVNRLNATMASVDETMRDFHGSLTQLTSESAVHGVQLTNVQNDLSELEEKLRNNGISVNYPMPDGEVYNAIANGIVDAFATNAKIMSATEMLGSGNGYGPVLLQVTPGWK